MGAHQIFFKIKRQATSSKHANRKRSLTRYDNRILDGPLSALELLVENLMLTHVQQCTKAEAHKVKNNNE